MKGLAKAGHEVTVISAFPQSKPVANWRDVEITGIFERMKSVMEGILDLEGQSIWSSVNQIYDMGYNITEYVMKDANVVKLMRSNEKFDLVICELFVNEAMLGNNSGKFFG
jgi:glucuronosyltransferase